MVEVADQIFSTLRQPAQGGENGGGVGRTHDRAEQDAVEPAEAEQPHRRGRDHGHAHPDPERGQHGADRHRRAHVRPPGGQPAFGQDQHQGQQPQGAAQAGVAEVNPESGLTEQHPQAEVEQEAGQAKSSRRADRQDRDQDHTCANEQGVDDVAVHELRMARVDVRASAIESAIETALG